MAHNPTADDPPAEVGYPQLDPGQTAAVAAALEQLIQLRQSRQLTERQLSEMRSVIGAQIADTERLHAFVLTNADEPAFVMPAGPAR